MRQNVQSAKGLLGWLETMDPGAQRRIKGLRLVTAYGIAALLGTSGAIQGPAGNSSLSTLAGGFALWASVLEARGNRRDSTRDLLLLCTAAVLGSLSMIALTPLLGGPGQPGPEVLLVLGSFLVGYFRRYGILGGGIGAQIFLGQLLAYNAGLTTTDLGTVGIAGLIAALGAVVPRVLSGPAEKPAVTPPGPQVEGLWGMSPNLVMGLQSALAATVIIAANFAVGLEESVWAITACTFVISGSAHGTSDRVRRRMLGTLVGVPLGIACLPIAEHFPLVVWSLAAIAMVIYAMALPERYDIACGAFAFTLMITMAASGVHSARLLSARLWETAIGATLGLIAATVVLPLRPVEEALP